MNASARQHQTFAKSTKRSIIRNVLPYVLFSFTALAPGLTQAESSQITLGNEAFANPLVVEGISGGKQKATEIVKTESTTTGYCNGYINSQPNHTLVLSEFWEFLKIEVNSSTDTTIIIEGPGGVWCNDDSVNANPAIEGQWQPGNYKIWVGSYQENVNHSYQIKITRNN